MVQAYAPVTGRGARDLDQAPIGVLAKLSAGTGVPIERLLDMTTLRVMRRVVHRTQAWLDTAEGQAACQSALKTFQVTASKSFQLIVSLAPTDCVVWAGTEAPGYRDRRAPSVASKAFRELGCLEIFDMAAQLQHGVERLRRCAVFET